MQRDLRQHQPLHHIQRGSLTKSLKSISLILTSNTQIETSKHYKPPTWLRCSPKREMSVWARSLRSCPLRLRERGVRVTEDDLCEGLEAAVEACLTPVRRCYDLDSEEGREAARKFGTEVMAAGLAWMGVSKGSVKHTLVLNFNVEFQTEEFRIQAVKHHMRKQRRIRPIFHIIRGSLCI